MLANFFDKSKPINFIVILVFFFSYFSMALFRAFPMDEFTFNFVLEKVGFLLIFLLLFFLFNFIVSKNVLTLDNSYAFLIFVTLFGVFPEAFFDGKALIVNLLSLFSFRKIYSLRNSSTVYEKLFDASLWIGIIFLFEPFFGVFFIILYLAIFLFQNVNFRTILVPVLGFLVPLFLYFTYCFWIDKTSNFEQLFAWYTNYNFDVYNNSNFVIPLILFTVLIIVTLVVITPKVISISGKYRKNWILLFFHLLIATVFLLLLKTRNGSELMILFFPISIIIANWLQSIKSKIIKNVLVLLLLISPFILAII